jgi:hypothetical protein
MNFKLYLEKFEKASKSLDKKVLETKGIQIQTGIWLDSVVLRLQKRHWANKPNEKPHTDSAIFMGIWMDNEAIANNKLFYNIHALRLRQLNGYKLQSRAFAMSFREKFEPHKQNWSNVSTDFAPQTLMEGWKEFKLEDLQEIVCELAHNFLDISDLIESTLLEFRK